MAMSCEQIDEQMVDFLYGELAPDARAAFEAHLGGCERCRREVESLGDTRALARTGLDEAPPAHVRARIVDAARAAMTVAVAAAAPVDAARVARTPEAVSLWRKLRGWWTLPTLATVGALAVFLLGSRLFLDPRKVEHRGRTVSEELSAPAAPAAPDMPAPVAQPAAPAAAVEAESRRSIATPKAAHRGAIRAAPPATAGGAGAEKKSDKRDLGPGALAARTASRSAPAEEGAGAVRGRAVAGKAEAEPGLDGLRDPAASSAGAPAAAPVARTERRSMKDDVALDSLGEEREAPAAESQAMDLRAPSRSRAKKERASADVDERDLGADEPERRPPAPTGGKGYPAPQAPSASAPSAPAPALAAASASAAPSPPPPAKAAKEEAKQAPRDALAASKPKSGAGGAETLVQRADRLFTEGRWVEAAVAYRDLLRQDPRSPDAPRWRRRLSAAESAAAAATRGAPP